MPAERTEASRRFGIPRSAPRRRGARTRGEARGARTRDPRGTRPPRAGATRGAHPGWSSRDASVRRAPRATRRAPENASLGSLMRGNPWRRAGSPRATARETCLSSRPRARAAVAVETRAMDARSRNATFEAGGGPAARRGVTRSACATANEARGHVRTDVARFLRPNPTIFTTLPWSVNPKTPSTRQVSAAFSPSARPTL